MAQLVAVKSITLSPRLCSAARVWVCAHAAVRSCLHVGEAASPSVFVVSASAHDHALYCRKDFYHILGVQKGVDDKLLKKAYRKLALKYHPVRSQASCLT